MFALERVRLRAWNLLLLGGWELDNEPQILHQSGPVKIKQPDPLARIMIGADLIMLVGTWYAALVKLHGIVDDPVPRNELQISKHHRHIITMTNE